MKKIGIFLDLSNLYLCLKEHYGGKRLDFAKYVDYFRDLGDIAVLSAYATGETDSQEKFLRTLKKLGFDVKVKRVKQWDNGEGNIRRKADWDVGMAVDIMNGASALDIVVIGSADGDMEPVVTEMNKQGRQVIICACNISSDLRAVAAQAIEIPESYMYERKPNASPNPR